MAEVERIRDEFKLPLGISEIKQLLPHRTPFLLIDKVTELELYKVCTAYKAVSFNEWFFQGHFPEHPVMPGVLIVEAMAQTAGILAIASSMSQNNGTVPNNVLFASISNVRFRKQVIPGDLLRIDVAVNQQRSKIWKFNAKSYVGDELSDEAEFTAMTP